MKSKGVCRSCNKSYTGSGMTRHLQACAERKKLQNKGNDNIFLIKAGNPPFWVYFELSDSSTLYGIDGFLRTLWLECCGHLSAFTIDSEPYMSHPEDMDLDEEDMDSDEEGMGMPLKKVLKPGMEFSHEYDFGTTTYLDLKCISERKGKLKKKIEILARNDMPEIPCGECGKPAQLICMECIWQGTGFLCESCAKKHGCDEDMFLPVVNSPRMGECGYTGPAEDPVY